MCISAIFHSLADRSFAQWHYASAGYCAFVLPFRSASFSCACKPVERSVPFPDTCGWVAETYRRAMRASNSAAADTTGEQDSEGEADGAGATPPVGATADGHADGAAPAAAVNPSQQSTVPFDHTMLDHRRSKIHMPALAQAFFNNGSDSFCGADHPRPRPPRARLFSVGFVGRRSLPGKRARSPESQSRSKVKHLRLQFGIKGFSGYITAIRESGCLLIKVRTPDCTPNCQAKSLPLSWNFRCQFQDTAVQCGIEVYLQLALSQFKVSTSCVILWVCLAARIVIPVTVHRGTW